MAELITQVEFAKRVGVSPPMVVKALHSGRIKRTPSGKIDYDSQVIA